jgi:hypothetical protein
MTEKTVLAFAEEALALRDSDEERLAHHPPPLDELSAAELDRLARVAYRIAQVDAAKHRQLVPAAGVVPWHELPERTRANSRATVLRIMQAAVLLGWIATPD